MDRPLLFGKFCLLERVSIGGMAEVFRAKPLNPSDPNRYFAVKRILPHLAEDEEFIAMFIDEARLTVQLRHPNVVQIFELGQFQSSHYIAMEFIAGKDLLALQKHVRRQETTVDISMACHILREIALGMDYVHQKTDEKGNPLGIIHRDISPQNVLVSWDGKVRVIDFGIAKAASQSTHTQAGVLKGKYGYMSPEQVRGGMELDHRSDIFSMGTLFWELLTNRRLFKAANQYEVLTLIGDPDVKPPSEFNPAIPPEVDRIAMQALQPEREERYSSAAEFAGELDAFLKNQTPPYHRSQLTSWMRSAFEEDYEEEKEKRERFREINSAEDVQRIFDDNYGSGGSDGDEDIGEATQIWDADVLPEVGEELSAFVADHTVVQAGGLELMLEDGEWADVPDTVQEVIEGADTDQEKGVIGGRSFEAEPTNVTVNAQKPLAGAAGWTGSATPPQGLSRGRGAATGAMPVTTGFQPATPVPRSSRVDPRRIWLALGAVFILGVLFCVALLVGSGGEEEQVVPQVGTLLIQAQPTQGLSVRVNGELVGHETPLTLENLLAGRYQVTVEHPDYAPWRGDAEIQPGNIVDLTVDLAARGEILLSWNETPRGLQLFVDGQEVEYRDAEVRLQALRGEVLVEAISPEIRPHRQRITVIADELVEAQLQWRPPLSLHLAGDRRLQVEVNGRSYGELEIVMEDLSPRRLYELKVGEIETVLGYPEIGRDRLEFEDIEAIEGRSHEDYGWLTVDAGEDWWHVFIDDVDTGLTTPITEEDKIPVLAGQRILGLQRGDQRYHVAVRIHPEETTNARPDLRISQNR